MQYQPTGSQIPSLCSSYETTKNLVRAEIPDLEIRNNIGLQNTNASP